MVGGEQFCSLPRSVDIENIKFICVLHYFFVTGGVEHFWMFVFQMLNDGMIFEAFLSATYFTLTKTRFSSVIEVFEIYINDSDV